MTIDVPDLGEIFVGKYAEDTFNRCMNESYRRCVANDEPAEIFTMVCWTLEWERRRQLMGLEPALVLTDELDPRITACRGPLYRVRITYMQGDEESYTKGRMEAWIRTRHHTRRVPRRPASTTCASSPPIPWPRSSKVRPTSLVPADAAMLEAIDPWRHQFAGPGAYAPPPCATAAFISVMPSPSCA